MCGILFTLQTYIKNRIAKISINRKMSIQIPVLYACCVPVKGANRSILCDLQRGSYVFIPNSLYEILTDHKGKTIPQICKEYENQYDDTIQEYFSYLIESEFMFMCSDPSRFPELNMEWDEPFLISNGIIDVGVNSNHDWEYILSQYESLLCKHLQIRSFVKKPLSYFEELLELVAAKSFLSVDIYIRYSDSFKSEELYDLCRKYPQIFMLHIHGAPEELEANQPMRRMGNVIYSRTLISSESHCGIIDPRYFIINTQTFSEGLSYNSCLHRKLSIDQDGYLKNCPSLQTSYGLVNDVSFAAVIERPDFKRYWEISKDQIATCKDCEFRYICTDCRAYIEDPEDVKSKPLKCGYNPYTNEFSAWNSLVEKEEAIRFYDLA